MRRRLWWQLLHLDVAVALAAGLPPIVDSHSWDVRPISELKDHLLGTENGLAYGEAVRNRHRVPDSADDPSAMDQVSMVSTAGIAVAGKFQDSCMSQPIHLLLLSLTGF